MTSKRDLNSTLISKRPMQLISMAKCSDFIKLKSSGILDQSACNDVNWYEIGLRDEAGSHLCKESLNYLKPKKHGKCHHKLKNRSTTQIICPLRVEPHNMAAKR